MKRVLIITYYWPPSGGSGVQRWLKYSKYLPEYGWEPVIFTPSNPEAPGFDASLLKDVRDDIEVIRLPVFEPYSLYKRFTGRKEAINVGFTRTEGTGRETLAEKLARFIRGNFFIPDARMFWIRPSAAFLTEWLEKNPVDAIISTGPPHSAHLIARKLKKRLGLPWLADFRDPWTGIDFYSELMLTPPADALHRALEHSTLSRADIVTTVSENIREELSRKGSQNVVVVPNGFDEADFEGFNEPESDKNEPVTPDTASSAFCLLHTGSLVPSRNPDALWQALGRLCKGNKDFQQHLKIRLIGSTDSSVKNSVAREELAQNTEILPYMPHADIVDEMKKADVLLLLINQTANAEGFLSGKVFEYLAAGKPILCVGPADGAAADLLTETATGITHSFKDDLGLEQTIEDWFIKWKSGRGLTTPDKNQISQYSRKKQSEKIAELLQSILD